jgi:hypothetical protein
MSILLDNEFSEWLQRQDIRLVTSLYHIYEAKPKGTQLIGLTALYGSKAITNAEINQFKKSLNSVKSFN